MTGRRMVERPVGQVTRGKTAPNRLRQTDVFLAIAYGGLVRHSSGVYIDLGYGAYPITTQETFKRLRKINPGLQVVGVEIDPARVREAEAFSRPGLAFRFGGFNLPLQPGEQVGFVRAFNVLRQYDESQVADAMRTLGRHMTEAALLLEGTCDPGGRLLTFNLYQRTAGQMERVALVLAPRLSALRPDFSPGSLRAVLPKNYIHHTEPGGAMDAFFAAWHVSWQQARRRTSNIRNTFADAAVRLADQFGYEVDLRRALLKRAFLMLGPTWPIPRADKTPRAQESSKLPLN